MAESFQIKQGGVAGLREAAEVFPNLSYKKDKNGDTFVYDQKQDEFVPVKEGDYIVSIGERFEVSETEPEKAHPVEEETKEAPKKTAAKRAEAEPEKSEEDEK